MIPDGDCTNDVGDTHLIDFKSLLLLQGTKDLSRNGLEMMIANNFFQL